MPKSKNLKKNEYQMSFTSDIEKSRAGKAKKVQRNKDKAELSNYQQKTRQLRINLGFESQDKKPKFNLNWKEEIKEFDEKYTSKPVYRKSINQYN